MTIRISIRHEIVAAALLFLTGCGADKPSDTNTGVDSSRAHTGSGEKVGNDAHAEAGSVLKLSAQEIKDEGIRIEQIRPRTVNEPIAVTAVIDANRDRLAHVAPRVPARIVRVSANLGDRVTAGQSLAVLDSTDVGEAHAAYLQARSELNVARAAVERAEKLQSEQIIAQKEYLRTRGDFERARAAFSAAEDRLRILGVAPTSPTDNKAISVFPLRSPFTGIVIEKHAILGELASPDKSLFTIADLSTLWIEADIYEKDLGRIHKGADAEIRVAAYPDSLFRGKLTYISDLMDAQTRTVKARIEVLNPDRRLKPQMFVTASIQTSSQRQVMALPSTAVTLIDGKPSVFVLDSDEFEVRNVETAENLGGLVVVTSGISPDNQVVVEGTFALKARMLKSTLGDSH